MAVIKIKDVVGYEDEGRNLCVECGNLRDHKPLTRDDYDSNFEQDDIVICDECGNSILGL